MLPAGPIPPDPGEFVGKDAVGAILDELTERADLMLIDAPPMLHVGDAMTLSRRVDALMLVTRMNLVRRTMLGELERLLSTVPAELLGFVLTGADHEAGYGYGYSYGYSQSQSRKKVKA